MNWNCNITSFTVKAFTYVRSSFSNKLIKDDYVWFVEKASVFPEFGTVKYYRITFEGIFYIRGGGYSADMEKNQSAEKRLVELERFQINIQTSVNRLTKLIALGTLVAAVYYLIEICKFLKGYFS